MMVTLADRMAESPLSVPDVVRISMLLAETLRGMHEQGRVQGAVCPRNLGLAESNVTLLDGDADPNYTAPEGAGDARSDIFSCGAIVFEMFLGRRPDGAESTGSAAVDRVVLPCLAADPRQRPARMQKILLELRWLKMAARRAAAASAAKSREASLAARLDAHERAIAADLVDIEESMRRQAVAMEAIRNQLTQTDVVVERMVKALESLQRAVLDRDESGNSPIVVN